ncbi:uncharacterized protein LOC110876245 [Helianthus annuus]|uniref:uncharacterized protein LOC110876245 n=1 Tax=Helianthus annuus TaxID=4232 RepID=UPI000B90464D|nr:uncharacterized protein LOC110876245 [Helianthus annuus]
MEPEAKLLTVNQVDPFIFAEIPNRDDSPELYTLVKDFMIHGPCGNANMNCLCMVDKQCSKGFPKRFQDTTTIDANGFPLYRRRDHGATVVKNRIELDNRRPDRAKVVVLHSDNQNEQPEKDEIKEYYDCRDACFALGLLDDDKEYIEAIKEANETATASYVRNLFGMMLLSNTMSRPEIVWESMWKYVTDDIIYRYSKLHRVEGLSIPDDELKNYALLEIEKFLGMNSSSLRNFSTMPFLDSSSLSDLDNRLINEERGKTAHSRFRIPLNLNEDSVCHIKADSDVAKLLHQTKLIIWDEAPMVHKHAFEALDRTMNDIFNFDTSRNSEISFGGKVIVFGGDFRQFLPVVRNDGRQETVNASLSSLYLWSKCKLLTLSRNMRLTVGRSPSEIEEINSLAKWLLDIGEGNVGGPNDGEATIEVPSNLLINDTSDPISSLIEFVYPSILENFGSPNYFSDRAILAPKNEVVNEINDRLLALFLGEEREYLSSDRLCASENVSSIQERLYTPDVLNGLKVSGLPNHRVLE